MNAFGDSHTKCYTTIFRSTENNYRVERHIKCPWQIKVSRFVRVEREKKINIFGGSDFGHSAKWQNGNVLMICNGFLWCVASQYQFGFMRLKFFFLSVWYEHLNTVLFCWTEEREEERRRNIYPKKWTTLDTDVHWETELSGHIKSFRPISVPVVPFPSFR